MTSDLIGKIWNEDCLETMKRMEDKSVDLIVTSPPYNTGGKSLGYHPRSKSGDSFYMGYSDDMTSAEYLEWVESLIRESVRIGTYAFWNFQMLSPNKDVLVRVMHDFAGNLKDIFIWQKQAVSQIQRGRTAKGYEFVLMFGQDSSMTFSPHNFPDNGYVPNIKTWYKSESIPEHHATFPIDLPEYFVSYWTRPEGIVYDPFMGSGTTAVACEKLGRRWIGSEINPEYVKIAEKRIEAVRAQGNLFPAADYEAESHRG